MTLFIFWLSERVAGGSSQKEKLKAEEIALWGTAPKSQTPGGKIRQVWKTWQGEAVPAGRLVALVTRALLAVEWTL